MKNFTYRPALFFIILFFLSVSSAHSKNLYYVEIETSDVKYAGTDAHVNIIIEGSFMNSGAIRVDSDLDDFERGTTRTYQVESDYNVGEITGLYIDHDNGGHYDKGGPGWRIGTIQVWQNNYKNETKKTFKFDQWLSLKNEPYSLKAHRTIEKPIVAVSKINKQYLAKVAGCHEFQLSGTGEVISYNPEVSTTVMTEIGHSSINHMETSDVTSMSISASVSWGPLSGSASMGKEKASKIAKKVQEDINRVNTSVSKDVGNFKFKVPEGETWTIRRKIMQWVKTGKVEYGHIAFDVKEVMGEWTVYEKGSCEA